MLSVRLVRAIEDQAEDLTRGVLGDLAANAQTPAYHRIAHDELHRRVYDVYHNLGKWLGHGTEGPIETTYAGLGQTRCREGIPLAEVVYALQIIKHHLRDYIRSAGLVESAVELYQEEELNLLLSRFFDQAVYHTVRGYECELAARGTGRP